MHVPDGKRDVLRHELGGGRVRREFSKRAIAVTQARKVKTLYMQSTPLAQEVVKLQDSSRFFKRCSDPLVARDAVVHSRCCHTLLGLPHLDETLGVWGNVLSQEF